MVRSNLVTCVGELLIDFFCTDINVNLIEGTNFVKQAGGAPANVAAAISKLGGLSCFVGKVGNDPFGEFLIKVLKDANVDTSMISKDASSLTTLAFVSLKGNGERDFVFSRGSDEKLTYDDIDPKILLSSNIIHFGSATAMLGGPTTKTYFTVMNEAQNQEIFVSFDPNYRENLWTDRKKEFIEFSKKGASLADFVKVSEEELQIISGEADLLKGTKILHAIGAKMIAVTLGKEGTFFSINNHQKVIKSVPVKSIDSTGAGDAFVGAILYQLSKVDNPKHLLTEYKHLEEIIYFANKVGAIVCTKVGAISALPTLEDVE